MNYTIKHEQMVCASAQVEERRWKCIPGKTGNWLVPINEKEPAAHVHFHDPTDAHSDGYAGRTLQFVLEDGTSYSAKGPWHSNADALFKDTGIDLRDQRLSFVVLSKGIGSNQKYQTVMEDVVYIDTEPMLGRFDRWKELVPKYPEANYMYSQTSGGSVSGFIEGRTPMPFKKFIALSDKAEALEEFNKATFGFDRREVINNRVCVPAPIGCGGAATTFRDAKSEREYSISGLCQNCQDSIFGKGAA